MSRGRLICPGCRHQTTATAGTIFDKTRTELRVWFAAIWYITFGTGKGARPVQCLPQSEPLQADAPVCFADISDVTVPLPPGTDRAQLLARFHVQRSDGQLISEASAFLALWAALLGCVG
jgi:hypothetical protein